MSFNTQNDLLSTTDIDYLINIGFKVDITKYSGFYFLCKDLITTVLVPLSDGRYKLEIYEMCCDGDGGWYEDMLKIVSKPGQTLQEFIQENL